VECFEVSEYLSAEEQFLAEDQLLLELPPEWHKCPFVTSYFVSCGQARHGIGFPSVSKPDIRTLNSVAQLD
jgi:hypothetical protein